MLYNKTQEEFDAASLRMIYALGQLTNTDLDDEIIEKCRTAIRQSGKVRIVETKNRKKIPMET